MIPAGEPAQIEHYQPDGMRNLLLHMLMARVKQAGPVREAGIPQAQAGIGHGLCLNIKSVDMAGGADQAAKRFRIMTVAHGGIHGLVALRQNLPEDIGGQPAGGFQFIGHEVYSFQSGNETGILRRRSRSRRGWSGPSPICICGNGP